MQRVRGAVCGEGAGLTTPGGIVQRFPWMMYIYIVVSLGLGIKDGNILWVCGEWWEQNRDLGITATEPSCDVRRVAGLGTGWSTYTNPFKHHVVKTFAISV